MTFPGGLPNLIDSGDPLDVTIELLNADGTPLSEFPGEIEIMLPGGVVAPSTIEDITLDNNGRITTTVNLFGDGPLQLSAVDPLSNASSTPQNLNLQGTAEEVTDHFRVTIGEGNFINPFLESTFPVTITGFRDAAETTEVDFSDTNQVAITITSTIGEFRILDSDRDQNLEELVLSSPTTTIRGFITNLTEFPNQQQEIPFSLNVSFTSLPDEIKGTATSPHLRDGSST